MFLLDANAMSSVVNLAVALACSVKMIGMVLAALLIMYKIESLVRFDDSANERLTITPKILTVSSTGNVSKADSNMFDLPEDMSIFPSINFNLRQYRNAEVNELKTFKVIP